MQNAVLSRTDMDMQRLSDQQSRSSAIQHVRSQTILSTRSAGGWAPTCQNGVCAVTHAGHGHDREGGGCKADDRQLAGEDVAPVVSTEHHDHPQEHLSYHLQPQKWSAYGFQGGTIGAASGFRVAIEVTAHKPSRSGIESLWRTLALRVSGLQIAAHHDNQ